ncbi:MAG: radical SAM protein [Ignavibacteriales bacterium]|nr:radical SAM protein [Ignavibacteriales bacterium]
MRVLLIDILRTSLEEVWPSAEHSLGLMYLASSLKKEFDSRVDVKIWTLISRPHRPGDDGVALREQLESYQPDLVGIRSLSIGKDTFHSVTASTKEWKRGCFVVAGGPYPTDDPVDALNGGCTDCVVIGEGEVSLNALVARLLSKTAWKDIAGIAYRQNGGVVRTPQRTPLVDLDALPMPDYSLIDLDRFSNQFLSFTSKISKPHANIMTTRGCPYRCAYCHNILGKKFRVRSPESVLAEMRHLYDNYGITDFQIIDDIFNLDMDRAKRICDLIHNSGMKVTLSFPNAIRGDRVDEELIDKMAAAGTKFISYAVETASPRLQKLIQKNLNLEKVSRAIDYTTKVGIVTRGFFMIGFPTETEAEVVQTIEYAKASALCGATFFTVVYFPGTELYRIAQSLGYYEGDGYDVQRDYVNVGDGPYEFGLETLTALKKKAIREFAFTKARIEQALRLLPSYFTQREIDGFFMAYVVSSRATAGEIEDETVRRLLRRYFVVADHFSKKSEFYV